jgi:hypothetical protein
MRDCRGDAIKLEHDQYALRVHLAERGLGDYGIFWGLVSALLSHSRTVPVIPPYTKAKNVLPLLALLAITQQQTTVTK